MKEETELIIGIDLGSNGLVGGIAKRTATGAVNLLALKQLPSRGEIRRGVVHNVEVLSSQVTDLLKQLMTPLNLDAKVIRVNIGLNGYTLRTVETRSSLVLSGQERLLDSHLDTLRDEAQASLADDLELIDIFPQEFLVDGKLDANPVGTMPSLIEGRFKTIVGRPLLFKGLDVCFGGLNIEYVPLLGPLASAEAVLTPDERKRGVAVFDFGAQTTSLIVYKDTVVRYMAVLPMGSELITKDLQHLNLDAQEAERIKLAVGTALHYDDAPEEEGEVALADKYSTFDRECNEVIVARIEEIVDNLYAQLHYAGIELQKLSDGLVITGGGSRLNGLAALLTKKTGLAVRDGNPVLGFATLADGLQLGPEGTLCAGLLLLGRKDCLEPVETVLKPESVSPQKLEGFDKQPPVKQEPREKPKPTPKPASKRSNPIGERFKDIMKNLFDDDTDV